MMLTIRTWGRRGFLAFAMLLVIRAAFLEPYRVVATSMTPSLQPGHVLVVDKQVFEWRWPQRWEIIVFHGPEFRKTPYVKRVIGLPGETVEIKDGRILINGEPVDSPLGITYLATGRHGVRSSCRLDVDEFFVLGDNSPASDDSRTWPRPGVKMSAIIGKPIRP